MCQRGDAFPWVLAGNNLVCKEPYFLGDFNSKVWSSREKIANFAPHGTERLFNCSMPLHKRQLPRELTRISSPRNFKSVDS
jgi:hypothetical protein